MTETKHTPTPWKSLGKDIFCVPNISNEGVDDGWIGCMNGGGLEQDTANAAFVTKAVNAHEGLVEAIKELVRTCSCDNGLIEVCDSIDCEDDHDEACPLCYQARAALALAEKRSQYKYWKKLRKRVDKTIITG